MEIELTGNGTNEDPYELHATSQVDKKWYVLHISDSHKPLIVKSLHLRALYLKYCTNVSVSDLTVKYLGLEESSKISIEDAQVYKLMWFNKSVEVNVSNSEIRRLFPSPDRQITFTNCEVKKPTRKSEAILRV